MQHIFSLSFYKLIPVSIKIFLLSLAIVTTLFLLQGNIGINLADEGFLWYGTIHTALGEVPIRDFQSYDPGRYYWVAAWFKILGNNDLRTLRISTAIFQSLGLTFGLLSIRRVVRSWLFLAIAGFVLLLWMYPNYYIFEPSIAMAAVYFAVLLLEKSSLFQHFIAGVFVGLSAFMGLNHGLYTFLSFLLLIILIWVKLDRNNLFRRLIFWGFGIVIGYSPMFLMLIFIPDFFTSFVDSIKFYFILGDTNLPLPVPWAWSVNYLDLSYIQVVSTFFKGIFFLMFPLFNSLSLIYLLFLSRNIKKKYVLIAATFVSLTYMHHAFSRADLEHLSASIHPMLIGLISLPSALQLNFQKRLNKGVIFILLAATLFSVGTASPFYLKASAPEQYIKKSITGNGIWINIPDANIIDTVSQINNQLVKPNEGLLIAPHWPTLYPIVQRKSPLWDIYFLFPELANRQKEMIEELQKKNVNWVILGDVALDDRDQLRFKNTHSLVWQHFQDNFEAIANNGLPNNYQLLHRIQP